MGWKGGLWLLPISPHLFLPDDGDFKESYVGVLASVQCILFALPEGGSPPRGLPRISKKPINRMKCVVFNHRRSSNVDLKG